FEGRPISVQTTGMGCPSAGIVFEELAQLGARRFVRVGTCGGLLDGMKMGDTVIAMSATADDTTPIRYSGVSGFSPTATFALVRAAVDLASAEGSTVHVGPIVPSGLFYDPDPTAFAKWKSTGHVGVEMEAAMMYTVAATHHIEALAMMTVSDVLGDDGSTVRISDEELKRGVDAMMHLACRIAVS
ncbi:MAG: purine-nucleoside phosphorylase, partial [Ilumatobacteraceae bacterium]